MSASWAHSSSSRGAVCPVDTRGQPRGSTTKVRGRFQGDLSKTSLRDFKFMWPRAHFEAFRPNSNLICPIVESNLSFKFTIFKFNHQIYHSNLLSSLFKTNSSFKFTFKFIQNKFINQIYFQVYLSYLPFSFYFISLKLS